MNYRHHFHAGNFADVMKHILLRQLLLALQKKPKGFLYLETHAGRGEYDLAGAAAGDSLARQPEYPEGIGRLMDRTDLPAGIAEYVDFVKEFDRRAGNLKAALRFYPGSPWFARQLARPQDRLALCELQPAECAALRDGAGLALRVLVHEMDGYTALRAMLPPLERRALVLVDPPYEAADEYAQLVRALAAALRRFPSGAFAVWYPLTERARVDEFFAALRTLQPPPTLALELTIAGEYSAIKLRGCGLVIINPPWQFEREAEPLLRTLAQVLAQAPGGGVRLEWIARE